MPKVLQPGDPGFDWSKYDAYHAANDPLGEAKNTLERANAFGAMNQTADIARIPAELAGLQRAADMRGTTRKATETLSHVGGAIGLAGLPAAAINPAIGGTMMASGGLATIPDYLRREFAPETGETPPGWLERGGAALALLPAAASLRGLRGAAGAKTAAKELTAANLPESWKSLAQGRKEIPYQMFPGKPLVQDISQMERIPSDIRGSQGLADLERSIASNTNAPAYKQELGRAISAEPTPNASAVFDRMAAEGQFGPEMRGFARRNPPSSRPAPTKAPRPAPKGRDLSKIGGPSLTGLRQSVLTKEDLFRALKDFQP